MVTRRAVLGFPLSLALPLQARAETEPWAQKLIDAAKSQVGVTVSYDPAYRRIAFPGGDVPRARPGSAQTSSSAPIVMRWMLICKGWLTRI